MQHTTRWVGWPGSCVPEGEERDKITDALRERHSSEPVWIPKDILDLYYNGFCNAVLWQLFHYVPVQMDFRLAEAPTLQQEWAAYQSANELFADAVLEGYHDGEVVWIQDYHLMLLPNILKRRCPTMKVRRSLSTPASSPRTACCDVRRAQRVAHHSPCHHPVLPCAVFGCAACM